MKEKKSRSRWLKFAGVLALIFGIPVLALARVSWGLTHQQSSQNPSSNTSNSGLAYTLPTGSDWPMYLHDPERTSSSNETLINTGNASSLTKIWSFKTNGAIAASATVVAGKVYIGSWDGYEYALDQLTGKLLWKQFLGQTNAPACNPAHLGVTSTATIENSVLYVGGGDSNWYALDSNTGKVLWKVFTGDNSPTGGHYNWSSPLLYQGYAYVGIASNCDNPLIQGEVMKINLTTHQVDSVFKGVDDGKIGAGVWTSPSLDTSTNTIFIASGTEAGHDEELAQSVYSLDATTLALKSYWHLPEDKAIGDSDFDTSPILFSDAHGTPMVSAVNKNGFIYVFNRNDLAAGPLWSQQIDIPGMCPLCEESSVSSNTFGAGRLYVAAGNTQLDTVAYRGSIDALDPTTGNFLWRHPVDGAVIGSLVYVNGLVIAGAGPTVEVLDASTGKRLYSYTTGDVTYASPSIAHGMIFEGSADGSLYAFGLPQHTTSTNNDNSCPSGWICQDVGLPAIHGAEQRDGSNWTISAGGTGLKDTYDQFHLTSQKIGGDFQISAKVTSVDSAGAGNAPQSGLIVRQSIDPTAPNYSVLLVPNKGIVAQYRNGFGVKVEQDLPISDSTTPLYLEIQRTGDMFQAAFSHDGITYTLIPGSNQVIAMPFEVLGGFALSSANSITHTRAVFSELAIGTPPNNHPVPLTSKTPCPSNWVCSNIGNAAVVGDQTFADGNWTIDGGGTDVWWDRTDVLRFVGQSVTGDGYITACVDSQKGNTAYLKSGIMVRASLDPDAEYYAAYAEADGGTDGKGMVILEFRDKPGIMNRQIKLVDQTVPICIQIRRVGDAYTTYTSTDGQTWTEIMGGYEHMDVPPIPTTALMGMVVTAKDSLGDNTAVFSHVDIETGAYH